MSNDMSGSKEGSSWDDKWWGKFLAGVFFGGAAYYLHTVFTDLESGAQQSVRINAIVALMYRILGHVPTVVIFGGFAVLLLGMGLYQLVTGKEDS